MQVCEGTHAKGPTHPFRAPHNKRAPLRGDGGIACVLVVGGGPAGCAFARAFREAGAENNAVVIEEHGSVGQPVQCAGLVGNSLFSLVSNRSVINVIDGARIFLGEESFLIEKKGAAAVVDRAALDRECAEGIEVLCGTKYLSHNIKEKGVHVRTSRGDFDCDYLVGADGPLSSVRASFALSPKYFPAVQYTVKGRFDPHLVELHIAQPFFSYIVPEDGTMARVGCIHPRARTCLDWVVNRRNLGRILSRTGGVIPVGSGRIASERIALLGDAACQVKPLTGGGLYYGLVASRLLARALSQGQLGLYEKLWNGQFGREIQIGLLLRRLYEHMDERELQTVFNVLRRNAGRLERCDFERHATLVSQIALSPSAVSLIPLVARMFLREFFL